jgi:hypothetical protein
MKFSLLPLASLILLLSACDKTETKQAAFNEIFPPQKIQTVALFRINGLNLAAQYFQGKSTAVKLVESNCDEDCMSVLDQFNNASHQSLLFFNSPKVASEHLSDLANTFKNVAITVGSTARSSDYFISSFKTDSEAEFNQENVVYLINQQGEVAGWIEDKLYSASVVKALDGSSSLIQNSTLKR